MASPKQVHQQFVEAWNNRDFTAFRNLLAENYTYTGADGKEVPGPDAGVAAAQGFATIFPDANTKILSLYEEGETSIGEFLTTGTQKVAFMGLPPTNKVVSVTRCNLIKVYGGRIYVEHDYMNMLSVLMQLGASIQPPGAGQS